MGMTDFLFFGLIALLFAFSALRSRAKTKAALRVGRRQFVAILPFFVAIFGLIGLLEALLSPRQVQSLLGAQRGVLAPLYAALLGGLATGPPAAVYPLGRYLLDQHASVAAVATLLIAWVAVGTVTLPAEIRFFGPRFAFSRWTLSFCVSLGLGMLMGRLL
jgi:uncharacterized membrane protein YraQ (UPF0718 family)